MVMMLALQACVKGGVHNFPLANTEVRLDSTNLPIVWIEVGGDSIMRDKRIAGRMKIIWNGEGRLNYADTLAHPGQRIDYQGYIAIRHRGNSTYNDSPKKPYSFRTLAEPLRRGIAKKKKVSLLGMGKDNNWALLAPHTDRSLIRDVLTFELARPWMEYVPQGRHCELILDGTYYGVFVLAEVVSKGKHRLDLHGPGDKGDALTGDYLMEVDCNDEVTYTSKYHPVDGTGKPYANRYILFQYKEPDHEDLSKKHVNYINRRIDAMEDAFARGDYRQHIDVMSFIDYQLMMELCHNVDAYRLSGKFYKRRDSVDPRFKMAIWDTDRAYGNVDYRQGWRTDTWMYRNNDIMYQEKEVYMIPFWWYVLNNDPAYTAQVKMRWAQYRESNLQTERLMATLDSLATVLTMQGAENRNSQAWPCWGKKRKPNYYAAADYDDEITHIRQWLLERIAWMDQQLDYQPNN